MPGTLVVMGDGSTKAIEDVEAGDSVLASPEAGPSAGAPQARQVTAKITGSGSKQLADLTLVGASSGGGGPPSGRAVITATAGHPMFVEGAGWVDAGDLKSGDRLVDGAGRGVRVVSAEHRRAEATVHNLTVADRHTFLVQDAGVRVLTHNTNTADGEVCVLGGGRTIPLGPARQEAWTTLDRIDQKGSPFPGFKGGKPWKNDGSQGAQVLPRFDAAGQAVSYREWDTELPVPGVGRGPGRVVTGSDGSAYATTDHYESLFR